MNDYYGRVAVVPQDPHDRAILEGIDQKTMVEVSERFKCHISRDWYCNTIANSVVQCLIAALGVDLASSTRATKAQIDFYGLFTTTVTIKVNKKAEKEGNINVMFEPGVIANKLIETFDPTMTTEYEKEDRMKFFSHDDPNLSDEEMRAFNAAYLNIDTKATYDLSNNYAIIIPNDQRYFTFAIAYQFITNIFRELLATLYAQPESDLATINFNDNIEFHLIRSDDGLKFAMRPGLNAKLLIKSDSTTEKDYNSDDDDDDDDDHEVPWRS